MVEFTCALNPESAARLHTALTCLSKISESIGIEITSHKLMLIAINLNKTTCGSITLDHSSFFQSFHFSGDNFDNNFRCQLYNKSLSSVFKGRTGDGKDPDSALERCEIVLQDGNDKVDCRLVITLVARSGVRKIYRLHYDSKEVMRAVFNRDSAGNHWSISAYMLKAFSEYFGTKTELLDFFCEDGRVTLTSYTEKVMKGSEVLKQPLQTQIEVDTLDFADFAVEDQMHVGISVKDFRAIVIHAETLKTSVKAMHGRPGRPMLMEYQEHGMHCEFTLSTTGQYRGSKTPSVAGSRQPSVLPQQAPTTATRPSVAPSAAVQASRQPSAMPPPSKPVSRTIPSNPSTQPGGLQLTSGDRSFRAPALVPSASIDEQSLFVTDNDNDQQWNEADYDAEEQDQLGWGDSYSDTAMKTLTQASATRRESVVKESFQTEQQESMPLNEDEVPPTQVIAGMKGLFD